jgi:cyclopropane fatty-acyl-phospholipid synthase-like methyltransferase
MSAMRKEDLPVRTRSEVVPFRETERNYPCFLYLGRRYDLTPDMQEATGRTYDAFSDTYAATVEWSTASTNFVWTKILGPLKEDIAALEIDENGQPPKALLCGAGTLRDVKMIHEINPETRILAFDSSENQLLKGASILNAHSAAENVLATTASMPEFFDQLAPKSSYDLVLMVATLQHLTKGEAVEAVGKAAEMLKPGGKMYTEIRFDPRTMHARPELFENLSIKDLAPGGLLYPHRGQEVVQGRVFADTLLAAGGSNRNAIQTSINARSAADVRRWMKEERIGGQEGLRFYNTYSPQEAYQFILECTEKYQLSVDILGFSPHITAEKPSFIRVFFSKKEW